MAIRRPLSVPRSTTSDFHRFPRSAIQFASIFRKRTGVRLPSTDVEHSSKGISLVHVADRHLAKPGDKITFSTWVVNVSRERMDHVCLLSRSFTNAGMDKLSYLSKPHPWDLSFGPLPPSEAATFTFSYVASLDDQLHGGELLSAMLVRARSSSGRLLWDECDALVDMDPYDATIPDAQVWTSLNNFRLAEPNGSVHTRKGALG